MNITIQETEAHLKRAFHYFKDILYLVFKIDKI
jgi:hypothetical protein